MISKLFSIIFTILLFLNSNSQRTEFIQSIRIFPDQIEWARMPGPNTSGVDVVLLTGIPDSSGSLYILRVHLREGGFIKPHHHPDNRHITILSGELYAGIGDTMDEHDITVYPAGSFFITPGGTVHYDLAKNGEVIYQEVGIGPTGVVFIE